MNMNAMIKLSLKFIGGLYLFHCIQVANKLSYEVYWHYRRRLITCKRQDKNTLVLTVHILGKEEDSTIKAE